MTLGLRRSRSLIISTLFGLARWQLLHYRKVQWIIVRRQEFEFLGCSLLVLWPCTYNLNVLSFSFLFAYFIGNQARQRTSCMWECFVSLKLQDKLSKKATQMENMWGWEPTDQFQMIVLPLLCDYGHITS